MISTVGVKHMGIHPAPMLRVLPDPAIWGGLESITLLDARSAQDRQIATGACGSGRRLEPSCTLTFLRQSGESRTRLRSASP